MLQLQPLPTRRLTEKAVQESAGAVGKNGSGISLVGFMWLPFEYINTHFHYYMVTPPV